MSKETDTNFLQRYDKTIIVLLFICGFAISLIQFLSDRSLWLDEANLSHSIIHRDAFRLLKPLGLMQVAPILFLQFEKLFSSLLPNSDYGLRIFPLLSYWLSIVFFFKIVKLIFNKNYLIIFGLSLFVLNPTLIYYSSEVKQYMSDVLVLIIIYYVILKNYKHTKEMYFIFIIAGVFGVFLSNVAPIILLSAGVYLFYTSYTNNYSEIKYLIITFIIWGVSFCVYYFLFIHNHPTKDFMVIYWYKAGAFLPGNPFTADFYIFLWIKSQMIIYKLFKFKHFGGVLIGVLLIAGVAKIIVQKKSNLIVLLLLPLITHLFLSSLNIYPFDKRLILYLTPLFIILILLGFQTVSDIVKLNLKQNIVKLSVLFIPLTIFALSKKKMFPYKVEEIKESINYINENIVSGDSLLLYYAAKPAFRYYQKIKYELPKSNPHELGSWTKNIIPEDIEYLDNLKSNYWILFSHPRKNESEYILNAIDSMGHKKVKEFITVGSSAYLFKPDNLNDTILQHIKY